MARFAYLECLFSEQCESKLVHVVLLLYLVVMPRGVAARGIYGKASLVPRPIFRMNSIESTRPGNEATVKLTVFMPRGVAARGIR